VLRKRKPDPHLAEMRRAFSIVAAHVDRAQRALLASIPTARDPGIPVAQALKGFGAALNDATGAMAEWQDERLIEVWTRCSDALREARDEAEKLRVQTGNLTFEQLNARVGDVLYPLETFADVERNLRRR
jgi:hypothetical protein